MGNKSNTNSTCRRCGNDIYCPHCGSRLNIINKRLDFFRKKYANAPISYNLDKLPERIKIKIVGLDRKSLFISCRDNNDRYKLTYKKGSIVSAPNTFGISCFNDLASAAYFLDYMAEEAFFNDFDNIITDNKYLVLLVKGLRTEHGSVNEAELHCHCSITLNKFYDRYPVEIYDNYLLGSNLHEDYYGVGWTPKGNKWYDRVRVLT